MSRLSLLAQTLLVGLTWLVLSNTGLADEGVATQAPAQPSVTKVPAAPATQAAKSHATGEHTEPHATKPHPAGAPVTGSHATGSHAGHAHSPRVSHPPRGLFDEDTQAAHRVVQARDPVNMHPPVPLRDARGELIRSPKKPLEADESAVGEDAGAKQEPTPVQGGQSSEGKLLAPTEDELARINVAQSCDGCHEVAWIQAHNTHFEVEGILPTDGNMRCLVCHLAVPASERPKKRQDLQSWLLAAAFDPDFQPKERSSRNRQCSSDTLALKTQIRAPSSQNCLLCHHDLEHEWDPRPLDRTELNFPGKDGLGQSADIHAGAGLACTDCHAPNNHPSRVALTDSDDPSHLERDPRGVRIGVYLNRPDHRFAFSEEADDDCTQCHSTEHHDVFPKASRHLQQISCQGCHTPFVVKNRPPEEIKETGDFDHLRLEPVLLPSISQGGKLAPFLVSGDELVPVHHGIQGRDLVVRECGECHADESRIASANQVQRYAKLDGGDRIGGRSGGPPSELYVFGKDSVPLVDYLGLLSIFGVLGVAGLHGGLRVWIWARGPKVPTKKRGREYMYSIYERFWHWMQAMVIILLLATGLEIHLPNTLPLFGFEAASALHQGMGILLVINAFLALFYHLASGDIRQFLPEPKGFFAQAVEQQLYYLKGIFKNEPHPFEKDRERKLNPMQKMAYLVLLNVLLPVQVVTGLAMLFPESGWIELFGGLPILAAIHGLCSWLLGAFLLLHLYLTTTGETPLALIKAMITGWEDHYEHGHPAESSSSEGATDDE